MNRTFPPTHSTFLNLSLLIVACATTSGCQPDGPERGYVEGTVLLDSKPLSGALVTFRPQAGGRPSYAKTDETGYYELVYTNDLDGALIGQHSVEISTQEDGDPDQGIAAAPEKLPVHYNSRTELIETVDAGDNEVNFELSSREPPAHGPPVTDVAPDEKVTRDGACLQNLLSKINILLRTP